MEKLQQKLSSLRAERLENQMSFPADSNTFLFTGTFRTALGQTSLQFKLGVSFPDDRAATQEVDNSLTLVPHPLRHSSLWFCCL